MDSNIPLAELLRPKSLKDFIGQDHLVGTDKPLRILYDNKKISSMIFWGPPGCGKTTLAKILAKNADADFFYLSATSAGKKEIKDIVDKVKIYKKINANEQLTLPSEKSKEKPKTYQTVLFLDEIHRFNKLQQDYLLPFVENGTLTLIGATTENPSFEVNSALLSRCRVYVLTSLTNLDIAQLIKTALKKVNLKMDKKTSEFLAEFANGDGRFAINTIEIASQMLNNSDNCHCEPAILAAKQSAENKKSKRFNHNTKNIQTITFETLKNILQKKALQYDKNGENHYDTISAFIKSMRASNIDSALYYLARMIDSGEDPVFIARRMVIFASEDIGLAVPTALVVANEVFQACTRIGMPEAQINLAHGVAYLCNCKKDRSAHDAYFRALEDVKNFGNLPIPLNIRNAPTNLMKELGYGNGYDKYTKESLLPDKIKNKKYYKKLSS